MDGDASRAPLSQEVGAGAVGGMFVPVVVRESSESEGVVPAQADRLRGAAIEVVLSGRCELRIPEGFEAATLRKLLQVLQEEGLC